MTFETNNSSTLELKNSDEAAQNSTMPDRLTPFAFKKGKSGNPGGRPKKSKIAKSMAEQHLDKALRKIAKLIDSKDERVALAAANAILDRAIGRPARQVVATQDDQHIGSAPTSVVRAWIREVLQTSEDQPREDTVPSGPILSPV